MRLPLVLVALLGALALASGPALASDPASSGVDLARARELADDPAGAAAQLAPYVALHPDDAVAGRLLGDLEFRVPDPLRAEAAWKRVLVSHPADADVHARLGGLYMSLGRWDEARVQYEADMPSPAAASALVDLHARIGDLATFVGDTAARAERSRFDPGSLMIEAMVLQALHRPAEAIGYFNRVVALGGGRCPDRIARATDELQLRRTDDAIADLQKCLNAQPGSYDAMALLGAAYLGRNQRDLARDWVERALAADASGFEALINRGVLDDADGAWQAAMRDDESAIAADPLRPEGYANLGTDLLDRNALTAAETTIVAGLRAAPGNGRLHYLLGRAYVLEGRSPSSARAEYLAALTSDEDDVVRAAHAALRTLDTH